MNIILINEVEVFVIQYTFYTNHMQQTVTYLEKIQVKN